MAPDCFSDWPACLLFKDAKSSGHQHVEKSLHHPPRTSSFPWGSEPLSNTWLFGSMRVYCPNGILLGWFASQLHATHRPQNCDLCYQYRRATVAQEIARKHFMAVSRTLRLGEQRAKSCAESEHGKIEKSCVNFTYLKWRESRRAKHVTSCWRHLLPTAEWPTNSRPGCSYGVGLTEVCLFCLRFRFDRLRCRPENHNL